MNMIDYEKLKIAHELADRLTGYNVSHLFGGPTKSEYIFYVYSLQEGFCRGANTVDNLLEILKNCSDMEQTYKKEKIERLQKELKILEMESNDGECQHEELMIGCAVCDTYKLNPTHPAYHTKEKTKIFDVAYALSDEGQSLIREGMKQILTCKHVHEKDEKIYFSNPPKYRCKRCGEFYI